MTEVARHPRTTTALASGVNYHAVALIVGVAVAVAIRLLLAQSPGFRIDTQIFQGWSQSLAANHPWHFYDSTSTSDYTPGYLYVLWAFGELDSLLHFNNSQWEFLLKLPSIVADLASAWLIYKLLDGRGHRTQTGAVLAYLFFPPALLIGAFWGQVDSILAFCLLLTAFLLYKDKPLGATAALTVGLLIKPQAIAVVSFAAFCIVRQHPLRVRRGIPQIPKVWLECMLLAGGLAVLLIAPFFGYEPWRLILVLQNATSIVTYRVNSFGAYNFWNTGGTLNMAAKCDLPGHCAPGVPATEFLSVATRYWGFAMFAGALAVIAYTLRNTRDLASIALGTALSMMAFFMLLTRMHERYLFSCFLPLLLACALIRSRILWGLFAVAAFVHFANLYYIVGYNYLFNYKESAPYPGYLRWHAFYEVITWRGHVPLLGDVEAAQILSIVLVSAFASMLVCACYFARVSSTQRTAAEQGDHARVRSVPYFRG